MAQHFAEATTATGDGATDGASRLRLELEASLFGRPLQDLIAALKTDARLAQAWTMIEINYSDPELTLPKAARTAGISRDHLNVLCRQKTSVTFHQLLVGYRLLQAIVLMRDGRDKVLEVALDVGFGSVRTFERNLVKALGTAPKNIKMFLSSR